MVEARHLSIRPHSVYFGCGSHALIEQSWAWLRLWVRVFCFRVSVLSVYAAEKANDLTTANTLPAHGVLSLQVKT